MVEHECQTWGLATGRSYNSFIIHDNNGWGTRLMNALWFPLCMDIRHELNAIPQYRPPFNDISSEICKQSLNILEWDTTFCNSRNGIRHFEIPLMLLLHLFAWVILCMGSANGRRRYIVTSSLIGWTHTRNDPWFRDDISVLEMMLSRNDICRQSPLRNISVDVSTQKQLSKPMITRFRDAYTGHEGEMSFNNDISDVYIYFFYIIAEPDFGITVISLYTRENTLLHQKAPNCDPTSQHVAVFANEINQNKHSLFLLRKTYDSAK